MASSKSAKKARSVPCVLAIGGLDPGGGAGVLADARAIAHADAFCCAAVAVLTVQSTSGLRSVRPVDHEELKAAANEVVKHQDVRAIKIGALGSPENVRVVADLLAIHRDLPAIVDTVMIPTRGRGRLLEERAVKDLRNRLLPRATLVTVNAPEAEVLTGKRITQIDEAQNALDALLRDLGSRAVLLKGGHIVGDEAIDLFASREKTVELTAKRLKLPPVHGGGCALASLIAGRMASRDIAPRDVLDAVRWAKKAHHQALASTANVGGDMRVLYA